MKSLIAQTEIPLGSPFSGIGKLGLEVQTGEGAMSLFTKFISGAVGIMTIIAFIWFVFKFVIGAIGIISAGSNKESLEKARSQITTGIIGVIVVIAAIFIIDLIGNLLGIPDIINPIKLLNKALLY